MLGEKQEFGLLLAFLSGMEPTTISTSADSLLDLIDVTDREKLKDSYRVMKELLNVDPNTSPAMYVKHLDDNFPEVAGLVSKSLTCLFIGVGFYDGSLSRFEMNGDLIADVMGAGFSRRFQCGGAVGYWDSEPNRSNVE